LGNPVAVRFLPNGTYYYLSNYDHKIRKVDLQGQISVYAGASRNSSNIGDGPANAAFFDINYQSKIARDQAGNIYRICLA